MIMETVCFAVVFAAEALTAWLYFEYLFNRNNQNTGISASFVFGYVILFIVSRLDNTSVNALAFSVINAVEKRLFFKHHSCALQW